MPTIQLYYDGWLTLPADARKHLDVATGDRLEIEFTDGALVLRPMGQDGRAADLEPVAAMAQAVAAQDEPVLLDEVTNPKRGPGRPRKTAAQEPIPSIKVGGRRKSSPA